MAQLGVTEAANPPVVKNLFGAGDKVFERVELKAGEEYERGQVLARTGSFGSYVFEPLERETVVSTAEDVENASANAEVIRNLANANILPSSFEIEHGSNNNMPVDPRTGEITTGVTGATARIDFRTGVLTFDVGSTGISGISCTYSYMDEDEEAAAIAINDLDLSDGTAGTDDEPSTVLAIGPVLADDLVWPSGMTDAEIGRQREVLREKGIIVQDY